jgi:outer membrane lipase/esterase
MGDSLVDNRNSFLFTQRILGPAGTVPQSPPYFRGRFSNGPNWTDRLEPTQLFYADYFLSDPACGSGNPAVAASGACDPALDPGVQPGVSMNFAFGGSRSGTDPLLPGAPGLLTVLDDLAGFDATGRVADLEGVHFGVWTGGNDYSNYVAAPGGLSEAQVVDRTLDNIQTGLTRMDGLGADRALVLNLFDLSRIPTFVNVLGRAGADQAGRLSRAHNAALGGRLAQVRRTTGLDLVLVDVAALYDDIYRVPGRYGFTNLTQGCIDETTLLPTGACAAPSSPDAALYWDGTHPTEAAHAQIHALVAATLQAPAWCRSTACSWVPAPSWTPGAATPPRPPGRRAPAPGRGTPTWAAAGSTSWARPRPDNAPRTGTSPATTTAAAAAWSASATGRRGCRCRR